MSVLFDQYNLGLWLVIFGLAVPPALRRRSWRVLFLAFAQLLIGVLLPAVWFLLSAGLVPEWKGGCRFGWVHCFVEGKLWLSPLVAWALAAFYAKVIWKTDHPLRLWITLGYLSGAIVSGLCLLHGLLTLWSWNPSVLLFTVPVAVAVYYIRVSLDVVPLSGIKSSRIWISIVGGLPLWAMSIWQSMKIFDSLPDKQPECFIVTAAMGGHPSVVGARRVIHRDGRMRLANQQLITFWAFEDLWASVSPLSHAAFRRAYNVIGPRIATRINYPLLADLMYLLLKPLEWAVVCVLPKAVGRKRC